MPTEAPTDHLTARLTGPRPVLDPRRNVARPDLVDIALASDVSAARYVEPMMLQCAVARTPMRSAGDPHAAAVSEILFGETFDVFETIAGWHYGRSTTDRYNGWVVATALGGQTQSTPHRISAAIAPVFERPDIKAPVTAELPFGARFSGIASGGFFALAGGGFVHARHVDRSPATPIAVARLFTGAPYLWGGRTPAGVDCSGLVQTALAACEIAAPRDSDQQRDELGEPVDFADRAPGDLIFFPGHVGILTNADTLLHANAFWMATVEESLADVIHRLRDSGVEQPVTAVRRL